MTNPATFSDLVREAFIDPIRSVLIVDDQYPTWEETLNQVRPEADQEEGLSQRSEGKSWRSNPKEPLALIQQFRTRKPALIVDIHDAKYEQVSTAVQSGSAHAQEQPQELAEHLHQSDFLVLDYELEGSDSGLGGTLARNILRSVLANQHFNLILVHTAKEIGEPFGECVSSLLTACYKSFGEGQNKALDKLADRLIDEEFDPQAEAVDLIDSRTYLELRHPSKSCSEQLQLFKDGQGPLRKVFERGTELDLDNGQLRSFGKLILREYEKTIETKMATDQTTGLNWSNDNEQPWLRTSRGFVGFVQKGPIDLLAELQRLIEAWKPTPSRLLSAKFRHEISCNGVVAEDSTLSKRHVFAQFYREVDRAATNEKRAFVFDDHVNRQTETLAWQISNDVSAFGEKIYQADTDKPNGFATHYGLSLTDDAASKRAVSEYNCYISTLPPKETDTYLECGHIFKLGGDHWLCATPACDMQPGQNAIAFSRNDDAELRPFTALRLNKFDPDTLSSEHINSGAYCFVEGGNGEVVALGTQLSSSQPSGNNGVPEPVSGKVTWRTFFARNDGKLIDQKLNLLEAKIEGGELNQTPHDQIEILAKLRYEYALNYVQKVGVSVTRIGLGYTTEQQN